MLPLQLVSIILRNVDKDNNVNYQVCFLEFSPGLGSPITRFFETDVALVLAAWCPMGISMDIKKCRKNEKTWCYGSSFSYDGSLCP